MLPFRLNRNLLLLALAGVLMYFGVMAWNALAGGGGVDEEMGRPPVTEEAAQAAASAWAARQFPGFTPGNSSVTYQNDKSMSAYVEKNDLTAEYKKTLSGKVPLDYWQVEVREQNGSRQLSVRVGMEQAVVTGWKTTGPRTGPAASDRTQADQALASAGYEPARFTPVPEKQKNPGSFVYRGKDTAVGEARLVLNVEVGGSEALSLLPSFELPDAFTGYMDKQSRSTKWMLGGSLFFTFVLGVAAIVYTIRRRKEISFSRGILLTFLFGGIYVIHSVNTLPLIAAQSGSGNLMAVAIVTLVFTAIVTLLLAAANYFSLLAGDALWRREGRSYWPRWNEPGFGEHVYYSMGRGYLLFFFLMGSQQILLLFAEKSFDAFGVNDPTQSVYNMLWPGLLPLLAWVAGISEEVTYRFFGIALFKKLLRFEFLALLAPSLLWALGHTGYTIYPSYTRLFEVAVLGLLFGYAFLKYGFYTVMFAHVIMDSFMMSFSVMTTEKTAGFVLLGLFYIALPALAAAAVLLLHRRFRKDPPEIPYSPAPVPPGAPQ